MPEATFDAVLGQIKWVQREMHFARWAPRDYSRLFGRRPVGRIIKSHAVNYMNSCLDLTMVLIFQLRGLGLDPRLVVEELIGSHTGKPALHFAAEVKLGKEWHTIHFKLGKNALVYTGQFSPAKSTPTNRHLSLQRFSTRNLGSSTTFFQLLGISGWKQIGEKSRHVRYPHIQASAKAMKKADSADLFNRIKKMRPKIRHLI
ncbi:MAG: hypothetical protein HY392_00560 [Candidatus Diapherotrites archaeon]|nr:hypothetical protein [Candidatus Diapherotrites archaeon]